MSRVSEVGNRSADGFTLAEMLVTLVVFSLVMVVMTNGLRSGAAVWAKVESTMGQAEQIAMSEQLLSGFFDRAYAVNTLSNFSDVASTANTSERFSFVYYSPPWPDEAGYVFIELQISDNEAGKKLDLIRRRMVPGEGNGVGQMSTRTSRLIEGVDRMEFSYLAQDRKTGAPSWQSNWDDPDTLPKVVSLKVVHENDVAEITFQINNALAPECVMGRAGFICEVRR